MLFSVNAYSTEYLCVKDDGTEVQISTFLSTITTPDGKYKYDGKTEDKRHYIFKSGNSEQYYLVRKHHSTSDAIVFTKHENPENVIERGECFDS